MLTLIKGGKIFTPEDIGICDILVAGEKIVGMAPGIDPPTGVAMDLIDAAGTTIAPGFVDLHVHLLGGGGEAGFGSRTPEIRLSRITRAGVTTVVGCLGTDNISRTPEALLAKAFQLESEGISAYVYTGSYHLPPVTITGSVKKDIALIPKVVGVGEIAVSDHRSSQPTIDDLLRVAADARVGGLIGGKAGLVHLHMGDGPRGLEPVFRMVRESEIPISQFLPTHVTRNRSLFEQTLEFAALGGYLDITAGGDGLDFSISTGDALKQVLEAGIGLDKVSISSDANGSMPVFDEAGKVVRLAVADIQQLYLDWRNLHRSGLPLTDTLALVTSNPARRTGLFHRKGSLDPGKDADLLILTPDLEIDTVMARGRIMIQNGRHIVKGTFES